MERVGRIHPFKAAGRKRETLGPLAHKYSEISTGTLRRCTHVGARVNGETSDAREHSGLGRVSGGEALRSQREKEGGPGGDGQSGGMEVERAFAWGDGHTMQCADDILLSCTPATCTV